MQIVISLFLRSLLRQREDMLGQQVELTVLMLDQHRQIAARAFAFLSQLLPGRQPCDRSLEVPLRRERLEFVVRREGWQNLLNPAKLPIDIFEMRGDYHVVHRPNLLGKSGRARTAILASPA
jgi:hypothetical protein